MIASLNEGDEIARAEALVAEQRAQLTRSLQAASRSGEKLARRLGDELKPAMTAAVVVVGTVAVVGVTVALVRRAGRRGGRAVLDEPSLVANAAKAAGLWALRLLAKRAAQEVVSRLTGPELIATTPNQVQR
jgi:hypothetical protein